MSEYFSWVKKMWQKVQFFSPVLELKPLIFSKIVILMKIVKAGIHLMDSAVTL